MKAILSPLLDPPAPHWSHDLPSPGAEPLSVTYLSRLSINNVNEIFLEIPRSTYRIRGISVATSLFVGLAGFVFLVLLGDYILLEKKIEIIFIFLLVAMIIACFWLCIYLWRMDTAAPRDEPIRFNRSRQKVYVYRFHHDGCRPLSKSAWFTRAEVYDWNNIRAEACSIYGPMGSGGLIEAVYLAVVEPGTNKVIDRFHFAHGGYEGEKYWAMARLYMKKGPAALPQFDRSPRDWNNEAIVFNLARHLAPKVKWPEDLDVESRTAKA